MRISHITLLSLLCMVSLASNCTRSNTFKPKEVELKTVSGSNFMELQTNELKYYDPDGVEWVAPKGTLTDGATVPWFALPITDGRFNKKFLKAAIVHDAYCQKINNGICPQYQSRPWRDVHRMFYHACRACGSGPLLAKTMFLFVWIFGPTWDDSERDLSGVSDEILNISYDSGIQYIRENEPTVEGIVSWVDSRKPILLKIDEFDKQARSATEDNNPEEVDRVSTETDLLLSRELEKTPNDLMLLNLRGFQAKSLASAYQKLGATEKESSELTRAENTFNSILKTRPNDPSANSGLSDVFIQRNELEKAEEQNRKVLKINPNHPIATRNLRQIERLRLPKPKN